MSKAKAWETGTDKQKYLQKVTFKMSLAGLVAEAFRRELVERGFSYKSISERLRVLFPGKRAVDKIRNMEHSGTFRNIPEHEKICKILKK